MTVLGLLRSSRSLDAKGCTRKFIKYSYSPLPIIHYKHMFSQKTLNYILYTVFVAKF